MRVWVFFYGSYINPKVLSEVGLVLQKVQVASLAGYALTITPRANLVGFNTHMDAAARAAYEERRTPQSVHFCSPS